MGDKEMKDFLKTVGIIAVSGALTAVTTWVVKEQLAGRAPKQLGTGETIDITPLQKKKSNRSKQRVKKQA